MKASTIGDNIRLFRSQKNISRANLASQIGMSEETLGRYERNERPITALKLMDIASVLECPVEKLIGNPTQPRPKSMQAAGGKKHRAAS